MMDITLIVTSVIAMIACILALGYTQINRSMSPSDFDRLVQLATIGVYAAEQIYKNFGGEDIAKKKYEEVKQWLDSKNLKVSEADIEKAIEAAVKQMKISMGG